MGRRTVVFVLVLLAQFLLGNPISIAENGDEVLAEIGEETITTEHLVSTLEQAYPLMLALYAGGQGKQILLRDLVDRKLFSKEAYRMGLDKQPRVQQKINAAIEKILSDELITLTVSSTSPPSEEDMITYYENRKESFQMDEQIKVRHILLRTEEEAIEVLSLIKAGQDFAKLADERCSACARGRGGELGWLGRGRMPSGFEEVAFSLKKGEVSGIVRTDLGYHIIVLEDRREPRQRRFFEVKSEIRKTLMNGQKRHAIELKRKELEKRYNVQIYPERLSNVHLPLFEPTMTDRDFLDAMQGRSLLDLTE